jgi:hypothetical protein
MPESSRRKLNDLAVGSIRLMNGVDYQNVPEVLAEYDIGLILYKGHIPNYVYNAPNKLFEYHSCGLDVWYPSVMKGCRDFATDKVYPKIVEVDFDRLDHLNLTDMISRDGCEFRPSPYTAEEACAKILLEFKSASSC